MTNNFYEPEGIYFEQLTNPSGHVIQRWGESSEYYSQFNYNGVAVLGYPGLGLVVQPDTEILAVDKGKVMEISIDEGGFGKYIKLTHWWGESIYALLGPIHVTSGQTVSRGTILAMCGNILFTDDEENYMSRFHFGIRISPYNRYDGRGGFADPLPYIAPTAIQGKPIEKGEAPLLPLNDELPYMRRP